MGKFNDLLNLRFKQKKSEKQNKVTALAEKSKSGSLSSFAGVFRVAQLSKQEKNTIYDILIQYKQDEDRDLEQDKKTLISISSEVKAITNQAVILHGERIKKAQVLLKNYQEGAFTAWLMATYGNRQTPYNFLQYFEFYSSMPNTLHEKIDQMPRQAIYTLASRSGETKQKEDIVRRYKGQTKQELLEIIRKLFPLDQDDKRLPNVANQTISSLKRLTDLMEHPLFSPSDKQKKKIKGLLSQLQLFIKQK